MVLALIPEPLAGSKTKAVMGAITPRGTDACSPALSTARMLRTFSSRFWPW